MATYEEIVRLVTELQGEEKYNQLKAEADQADTALKRLIATQAAMGSAGGQMADMIEDQARALHKLREEMEAVRLANDQMRAAASKPFTITDPTPVLDPIPGKTFDPKRAAAKSRLGLGVLNMAQDTIQGGSPAYAINNILGMAGDQGIKGLTSEWLAMAGGVSGVATALGSVAAVAGAAFLVIDHGLSTSKVGWGDLGSVVDNIFGGAVTQAGKNISDTFTATLAPLGKLTDQALDYWTGWDAATAKVRDHKAEIEKATASALKHAESLKTLANFKSDDQKTEEAKNKRVGEEIAALGGAKGTAGVVDKLVWARVGSDAAKMETREVGEIDEKTKKPTGETKLVTRTKGEWAREAADNDLADALSGNEEKRAKILQELRDEGLKVDRIEQTIKGRNFDEEEKTAKAQAERVKKREDREKLIDEATRTQSWKGWDEGDLTPEEKEAKRRFDEQVRAAQKSKEFIGLDDSQLTPAELEAKRLHQEREAKVAQATTDRAWLDANGEMKEEDSLTPEQLEAKKRAEKIDKANAKALADARKSRSFMGKSNYEMTEAEREAKRLHDEQEAAVAESLATRSFEGKETEDLTPAEAIAKRRDDSDERRRNQGRTEAQRIATERRREQLAAPGLDDYLRDALLNGATDVDLDKQLQAMGIDAEGRNDLIGEGQRNAFGKLLKDANEDSERQSQTLGGGADLRDAIQAGVKNEDLTKSMANSLIAATGYLKTIAERDQSYTAVAG